MRKFIQSFTLKGQILLVINIAVLIVALILKRYGSLPFVLISVLCAFASFRKRG